MDLLQESVLWPQFVNKKTPRGVDSSSFKGIFTKINFFFKEITKNDAFHPKLNFMQKE